MESTYRTAPGSNTRLWSGWIMSAVAILFLLFDGVIHMMKIPPVVESFGQLGYPAGLALGIGILELVCLTLYVIPRTAILGAVLLTGYLGGAVASQVRIGAPLFSHALFPVYVGLLVWGGLYARESRLRVLIPLRS